MEVKTEPIVVQQAEQKMVPEAVSKGTGDEGDEGEEEASPPHGDFENIAFSQQEQEVDVLSTPERVEETQEETAELAEEAGEPAEEVEDVVEVAPPKESRSNLFPFLIFLTLVCYLHVIHVKFCREEEDSSVAVDVSGVSAEEERVRPHT